MTPNLTNLGNASLQVIATGLVALGAITIADNLTTGIVEIVLGLIAYLVYELTPTSQRK